MSGGGAVRGVAQRVSVQFRAATIDDVPAVLAIERQSFSDPWSLASFLELVERSEIVFEVAVADGGEAPTGERPTGERSSGERSSGERSSGERSSGERSSGDRRGGERGAGALSEGDRTIGAAPSVVGFAIVYLADLEGDLANLATSDVLRRRGVGRRLLHHVLGVVRARGARTIFLEVRESNIAARALYDSAGFMEVGRRSKYYVRPVEDALLLRKDLD